MGNFHLYRAGREDMAEVTQLLVRKARWLSGQEAAQWMAVIRGKDTLRTADAIERGDVYVYRQGNLLLGLFVLLKRPSLLDDLLWHEDDGGGGQGTALYMHRLTVNRDLADGHAGGRMLAWAEEAGRFPGKRRIRLCCLSGDAEVNGLCRAADYRYMGEDAHASGMFRKYEKTLTV